MTASRWVDSVRRLAANTPPSSALREPEGARATFGTVRGLSPLRIALDNDPGTTLPYDPPCLAYPTAVGQRVYVSIVGSQVVILGVLAGGAPQPKAFAIMHKTNGFQGPTGHFNNPAAFVTLDWANAKTRGDIGVQAAAGHGEIMIRKSGWYRLNARFYLTGSGTGLNYLRVQQWFGDFRNIAVLSNNRTQNANDEFTYLDARRYLDAGANLMLTFTGPTHTWGNANLDGTYLSVEEI